MDLLGRAPGVLAPGFSVVVVPSKPPHAGGGGHLPDTGSPAGLAAAGLAGGGLLTLGGVLLYRARRRSDADRLVG
ncbi:LPXTG cell wall anchor domain-containing protein [Kitasatospora sp. NPDC004615]|uniref:LPXTG cell wall anchor domain-containing protein n=1 Tax=Kitasatospora sp. NPDC004615 TaxID=3364017 RepID=UPI0036A07977